MSEKKFVDGMIVKRSDTAPDFVLADVSVNVRKLIAFLETLQGPWENIVLKRGKSGKCYAELDTWKPSAKPADVVRAKEPNDEIPF